MYIYVIENETKNKRFVGLAINDKDPVAYHKNRRIVDLLHHDIKSGDRCSWIKLATPARLGVAERMLEMYIESIKPEYNVD